MTNTPNDDTAATPAGAIDGDQPDETENIPDGSGTDASEGDDEQDTVSGGSPEEPTK